jgi:hypothetical protein
MTAIGKQIDVAQLKESVRKAGRDMRKKRGAWFAGTLIAAIIFEGIALDTRGAGEWLVQLIATVFALMAFICGGLFFCFSDEVALALLDAETFDGTIRAVLGAS